jgi:hypothetical protein
MGMVTYTNLNIASDWKIEARLTVDSGYFSMFLDVYIGGVVPGHTFPGYYYHWGMDGYPGLQSFGYIKYTPDGVGMAQESWAGYSPPTFGTWVTLGVERVGNQLNFYYNSQLEKTVTDTQTSLTLTGFGMGPWWPTVTRYDRVQVWSEELPALTLGVMNIVGLSYFSLLEKNSGCAGGPCFTIQQNFEIHVPGETAIYEYWAQNIVLVTQKGPSKASAGAIFQIFKSPNFDAPDDCWPKALGLPFGACARFPSAGIEREVGFRAPVSFQLISYIDTSTNKLIMMSSLDGSQLGEVFEYALPAGSWVNTATAKVRAGTVGPYEKPPELVIVSGASSALSLAKTPPSPVQFRSVGGEVQSFLQVGGEWSASLTQTILTADCSIAPTCPQTGERSQGLVWTKEGANMVMFVVGSSMDQGVSVSPV